MRSIRRFVAFTQILLILPALLFMTALFVRNLQPQQYEPARSAQAIVSWYAARPHLGLWVMLIALPLTVFLSGSSLLWGQWQANAQLRSALRTATGALAPYLSTLTVTAATLSAGGVLAIVAVHLITG